MLAPRQWLGLTIVTVGAALAVAQAWAALGRLAGVQDALLLGAAAALATALGVLPMVLARAPTQRTQDALLGFGAGLMLAATCFSLLNPAFAAAGASGLGPWPRALGIGAALLAGAGLLMWLERVLPHAHFFGGSGRAGPASMRRSTLFVLAIVLHNLPEGLAIGVAAAGTNAAHAMALATGIAIQDVPEGLIVALALHRVGMRRATAAGIGAASGLVEPLAAALAAATLALSGALLPWGLALAAGAMLFVVSHEVIPESHRQGHERWATTGLLLGFTLMMTLDTALG
ncbi:ZIP family metal transporter [Aquabacterium sp. OR-4]|uniref:ZIP family metal transporter n=1 Tax=Aquabacterium sp. OR-4 TaxID=2978127 RepID=UPI0021B3C81C|nr:ZIP family metal transporter [Aquabacterium sp. OR-4]MDT7838639.1 ZIP family metal transporter [Aquabacterium sp. OR-4]